MASMRRDRMRCNEWRKDFGDIADQFEQQVREAATFTWVAADLGHGQELYEALARARR
jgi:hypothetical protein